MKFALVFLLALTFFCPALKAASEVQKKCPVCSMTFQPQAPTSFRATQENGTPHEFCSFSCSLKFHRKFNGAALEAHDFISKKPIDAKNAFFIANSKALLKELDFDMPPSVIAFAKKSDAEAKLKQLKDGTLIEGYSRLEKFYE